jgi:hypothetical protein
VLGFLRIAQLKDGGIIADSQILAIS